MQAAERQLEMNGEKIADLLTAGDFIERLGAASVDDLRLLLGRLEDATRVAKAVLRERTALARRNAGWKAREQLHPVGAEDE